MSFEEISTNEDLNVKSVIPSLNIKTLVTFKVEVNILNLLYQLL